VSGCIAELIGVLKEKRDSLECMQSILEEENRCIIGFESDSLTITSARKEQIIEKISVLNEKCRTTLQRAHRELGTKDGGGLSSLIARLKQPEKDVVRALQKSLLIVAKKNEQLLAHNKGLLESSIGLVNRSLKFLFGLLNKSDTYGIAGRMMEASAEARLIRKEM
jgi:hypothetical protein